MNKIRLTQCIKDEALRLGFDACGIAKAEKLDKEALWLEQWLNQNQHGAMKYMENYFDKRIDPRLLVEGARSVISLACNYYTDAKQADPKAPKIAMYALGKDYHEVVKEKTEKLLSYIRSIAGNINARCFVDSAPVMEKAWAVRSGIGWIGKNSNILSKRRGSYFFLAEIITDLELHYDSPVKDYCGRCTRCIDACPTGAIEKPYSVNASRCISYFTIEWRGDTIPDELKGKFENWMFGCDICQQVCPINAQAKPHNEPELSPLPALLQMTADDWKQLNEETYRLITRRSPLKRAKFKGIKRNITFLQQHKPSPENLS
ncbi:MAG: tRNA epoxyqueuosine(34) reductase QueG [Chitinophagales bacterium]|nr:tRNA epoxyqueuosine(34) reductase QueG [Chitinophagales bacterium]MDW8420153.1 tRNA epoxyqueuosine(34) reductase QueG [Chitinophagales bacterium]